MVKIELDLNSMTAEQLAALYVAVNRYVSTMLAGDIYAAGVANCGNLAFAMLVREVKDVH